MMTVEDRYASRTKGTMVHLLDLDKANAYFANTVPEYNGKVDYMAVVVTEKGLATLCTEGVGWNADAEGKVPINISWGMSMGYIDIPIEDLEGLVSDEKIDLADFIRVFGDRLENNFYIWKTQASKCEQKIGVAA